MTHHGANMCDYYEHVESIQDLETLVKALQNKVKNLEENRAHLEDILHTVIEELSDRVAEFDDSGAYYFNMADCEDFRMICGLATQGISKEVASQ